ncbi:MAG: hypothetical protein IJV13_02815 [Prevotella sp.]|nr:hypothetical protein [Prevotella sp.]
MIEIRRYEKKIDREQSDARIDSAEREQTRPEVKEVDQRLPECPIT